MKEKNANSLKFKHFQGLFGVSLKIKGFFKHFHKNSMNPATKVIILSPPPPGIKISGILRQPRILKRKFLAQINKFDFLFLT